MATIPHEPGDGRRAVIAPNALPLVCRACGQRLGIISPRRDFGLLLLWCQHCKCYSPREPTPGKYYDHLRCGTNELRRHGEDAPGDILLRGATGWGCGNPYGYARLKPGAEASVPCPHCSGIVNSVCRQDDGTLLQWVAPTPGSERLTRALLNRAPR